MINLSFSAESCVQAWVSEWVSWLSNYRLAQSHHVSIILGIRSTKCHKLYDIFPLLRPLRLVPDYAWGICPPAVLPSALPSPPRILGLGAVAFWTVSELLALQRTRWRGLHEMQLLWTEASDDMLIPLLQLASNTENGNRDRWLALANRRLFSV
jgi:hypothetical protein